MLTKTVAQLEEAEKLKDELQEWMKQQTAVVAEWKSKPVKLRVEANTQDLSNIKSIIPLIEEKRKEITDPDRPEDNELLQQLNSLEEFVRMNIIGLKNLFVWILAIHFFFLRR